MAIRIGHWIRGWRLDKFFKKEFNKISEEARKLLPVIIKITNEIKEIVDSDVPDILVAFTPGKWDNEFLEKARVWLPTFIFKLDIANATANIEDPFDRANAILKMLKFSDKEEKDDFYHKFSYRLFEFLADGNLTRTEVIVLAEIYYKYQHKEAV